MVRAAGQKLNSARGVNRLAFLLAAAVLVLLVLIAAPLVRAWLWHGELDGCDIAVRRTRDMLRYETLANGAPDPERARKLVTEKGSLCPSGGDFYVIPDVDDPTGVTVVCGLHDGDSARRTRLNAGNALEQLTAILAAAEETPDTAELTLNGAALTAQRADEAPALRRGTRASSGYSGTVALYVTDADGTLTYFCYADPDHCMRWRAREGWLGEDSIS